MFNRRDVLMSGIGALTSLVGRILPKEVSRHFGAKPPLPEFRIERETNGRDYPQVKVIAVELGKPEVSSFSRVRPEDVETYKLP